MPRRTTHFFPGGHYHIFNRGAMRGLLFHEPSNYQLFVYLLDIYAQQNDCSVLALCLMPNHFHVFIRQNGAIPAGDVIAKTCLVYTRRMNHRYRRFGTMFQGRFKSKTVKDDAYLLHLCRYIHANPVVAGLVTDPGDWEYSNFAEFIGRRDGLPFSKEFVAHHFPNPVEYRDFVQQQVVNNKITNADLARDLAKARLI